MASFDSGSKQLRAEVAGCHRYGHIHISANSDGSVAKEIEVLAKA